VIFSLDALFEVWAIWMVVPGPPHLLLINVRALSEARNHEGARLGEVLCARSIEPFEGGRRRLRWMRANGWSRSNGYREVNLFSSAAY
jgi:hypothetical protein